MKNSGSKPHIPERFALLARRGILISLPPMTRKPGKDETEYACQSSTKVGLTTN